MSSFHCEHCGTACIDTPHGYLTGCEHYPEDYSCKGCKHERPGDCANKVFGEDGYWHWPEGDCWE